MSSWVAVWTGLLEEELDGLLEEELEELEEEDDGVVPLSVEAGLPPQEANDMHMIAAAKIVNCFFISFPFIELRRAWKEINQTLRSVWFLFTRNDDEVLNARQIT